jgi:hypothetical protein
MNEVKWYSPDGTQTFTETLTLIHCANCGMPFGISEDFEERRRNDHMGFYCPNGHSNVFKGTSEAEKLKRELAEKERSITYLRDAQTSLHNKLTQKNHEIRAHKGAKTRILNRVKNGVCPCCNRHFTNLERHMKNQHPEENQS